MSDLPKKSKSQSGHVSSASNPHRQSKVQSVAKIGKRFVSKERLAMASKTRSLNEVGKELGISPNSWPGAQILNELYAAALLETLDT